MVTTKKILNLFLLFTLIFISTGCEEDDEESGNGGSFGGVWVRTQGASGDETDIAIGGIAGEPNNRVYMCEWQGSVGLYKGYIDGNTITWDNGMADAHVRMVGSQLEFSYPSLEWSIPTLYNSGSWSNHCGSLSGGGSGGGGSTTGNIMFWTQSDLGCGQINVTVSGQSGTIGSYYSSGAPNCGANGCANFTLPPGTYTFSATCQNYSWNNTITVTAGGCSKMRLYL